ncbi:MAG: hypothetical protein RBQ66_07040, partial [Candidatus Cloacimonadaceae bacterium]|nr:hypothetical protein [Candidatus Cloacimonadaceae bacterium]
WGGKLCLPQRAQLASEGSSAASAKQELGSPFPTRTEREPFCGLPTRLKREPCLFPYFPCFKSYIAWVYLEILPYRQDDGSLN